MSRADPASNRPPPASGLPGSSVPMGVTSTKQGPMTAAINATRRAILSAAARDDGAAVRSLKLELTRQLRARQAAYRVSGKPAVSAFRLISLL